MLTVWFIGVMGYRGRTLGYGIAVIVFTGFCIWCLINRTILFAYLEEHFGVWGMSGILLLFALSVWLCIKLLF